MSGAREWPDLAKKQHFLLPDGTEVALDYEDTGKVDSNGLAIYRLVTSSTPSGASMLGLPSFDLTNFATVGTWVDESGDAITSASLSKLVDGDPTTYFQTIGAGTKSIYIQFNEGVTLDSVLATLADLTITTGTMVIEAYLGDGTTIEIYNASLPTVATFVSYDAPVLSDLAAIGVKITIASMTALDEFNLSSLGIKARTGDVFEQSSISTELYAASVAAGATVFSSVVDLNGVKSFSVSAKVVTHASATAGVDIDAIASNDPAAAKFDDDLYAIDLEPTFVTNDTKQETTNIDPTPRWLKFMIENLDGVNANYVYLYITKVY